MQIFYSSSVVVVIIRCVVRVWIYNHSPVGISKRECAGDNLIMRNTIPINHPPPPVLIFPVGRKAKFRLMKTRCDNGHLLVVPNGVVCKEYSHKFPWPPPIEFIRLIAGGPEVGKHINQTFVICINIIQYLWFSSSNLQWTVGDEV